MKGIAEQSVTLQPAAACPADALWTLSAAPCAFKAVALAQRRLRMLLLRGKRTCLSRRA